ncbi:hypothetical protein D3C85_1328820 [compost metagenome]
MKHPVIGQAPVLHQGTQLVIRGIVKQAPRQQQGTGELPAVLRRQSLYFRIQKALVEGGVVGDQIVITDKVDEIRHHLVAGGSLFQHGIADPGILLDEAAHVEARIHQCRETLTDTAILDSDGTDLDGSIPLSG